MANYIIISRLKSPKEKDWSFETVAFDLGVATKHVEKLTVLAPNRQFIILNLNVVAMIAQIIQSQKEEN